jgi:hypothetical protein
MNSTDRPKMSSARGLYRSYPDRYPIDVFSYTREAAHCFVEKRFLACIAMASSAVEIILNRDRRLKVLANFRSKDGWAYLNNRTLRIARDYGLPSDTLLSAGDDLDSERPIAFVHIRNKIAHRDITYLISDPNSGIKPQPSPGFQCIDGQASSAQDSLDHSTNGRQTFGLSNGTKLSSLLEAVAKPWCLRNGSPTHLSPHAGLQNEFR